MADQVQVDFIGNIEPLERSIDKAKTDINKLAQKPVDIPITISRGGDPYVAQSPQQVAKEAELNAAAELRVRLAADERLRAVRRAAEAEEYAANERRLQALSVAKHEEYLLDKAAQEGITDTVTKETEKRTRALRGFGAIFRVTGLYQYGIDESSINAAIQGYNKINEASKARAASAAAGAAAEAATATAASEAAVAETELATATSATAVAATEAAAATEATAVAAAAAADSFGAVLGVFLPLLAAAAVLAIYSKDQRTAAEARLKIQEAINIATAAELTYQKQLTDEVKKQRGEAANARELDTFKGTLGGRSQEQLTADISRIKGELDRQQQAASTYNAKDSRFELSQDELIERKKLTDELTATEDALYKKQQEGIKQTSNFQQQANKVEEEAREARNKSIEEGIKKAADFTKSVKDAFQGLNYGQEADNPFVKVYSEAAKASETFHDKTKGLNATLLAQGEAILRASASYALFKATVDNALAAYDLKSAADRFRNPTKGDLQDQLKQDLSQFARVSNSTNPDVLYRFQQRQQEINDFDKTATQKKVDDQLEIVSRLSRGGNEDQKSIADAKLAQIASSLRPEDLRADQRSQIADVLERQATRTEARQSRALALQEQTVRIFEDIEKNGIKLQGIAKTGGLNAVNGALTVKIQDETSGSGLSVSSSPKSPTPEDTAKTYTTDLTFSGAGGLSNT